MSFAGMSRRRALILVPLGALLLYTLIGFVVVPWITRKLLIRQAAKQLHRQATLAGVRVNPFTLEVRFIGLDLRDRDGSSLLAFDTLVVNAALSSIVKRAWVLDEFRVVRPVVAVRIEPDGQLAIADLLVADSVATHADTAASVPPRLVVHHLAIQAGSVRYTDRSRTPEYDEEFKDLGLAVNELSTLPREEGGHELTVSFAGGAQIKWSGHNSFQPLKLEGQFSLQGLRLWKLAEVFGHQLPLHLSQGLGDAEVHYLVDAAPAGGVHVIVPDAGVTLKDLAVVPQGTTETWFRAPLLEVQGAQLEWPARTGTVKIVRVTEPWVTAARLPDGTISWDPYLARMRGDSASSAADSLPWKLRIDTVAILNGSVALADRTVQPALALDLAKIEVRLAPVSTDPTAPTELQMSANIGKRGALKASGKVVQEPFAADLDVNATGLDLKVSRPYLGAAPPATITSGTASAQGKLRLRKAKPSLAFDGKASVDQFALNDTSGAPLLTWVGMKVGGIHYTAAPDLLRIKTIALNRPFARIAVSRDSTINLMKLQAMMPASDPDKALPYEILEVAVVNGLIDFSDETLILPFRAEIDSTHGFIRDVASFGGAPGSVELEGWIAPNGLARVNGTLQASDPYAATDLRVDIRNFDMPTLTPYSAQFAGYAIKQGRLDMDLNYHIRNRQLNADHHIVATDLALGDKVEGGESPGFLVKVAISLMKDKDGKIKLDVPVEGTVDDPQFSYKGIVWRAMKQILGKIATAPFRFLGKLLGIGGDDVELVDFDPGRSDLIPPEREKLDSLAAEMGRKPDLTLSIEGRYDSISDAKGLREAKLQALISVRRDSLGKKAQQDTSTTMMARILEQLYTSQFSRTALDSLKDRFTVADTTRPDASGKKRLDRPAYFGEMREQLVALQPLEAGELEELGRDRATSISTALTAAGTLDAARVSAVDPAPVKKKKQGSSRIPSEMVMDAK